VLKFLVEQEDGLKKKTLMRVCHKEMIRKEASVTRALQKADPREELQQVLVDLQTIYDRANQQDAWPWIGKFCPNYKPAANQQVQEWVQNWRQGNPPIAQIPAVPGAGLITPAEELRAEP